MIQRIGKWMVWAAVAAAVSGPRAAAETRYVSPSGLHVAPFTNWAEASTNIQSAIDACAAGDVVVVTNGTYAPAATVRVTNGVTLASLNGRDTVVLDGSALSPTQDAVFLQFGTLDGIAVSNAPRHGVKSEYGAIYNSLITHSRSNGIDSYTTPRIASNSTLVVTNTVVRKSGAIGIFTCAVDTRIDGCTIAESASTGVSLQQNDTTGVVQVPRVSNFIIRASAVSSNRNSGIMLAFLNFDGSLPDVPVRIEDCRIEDNVGVNGGGVADAGGSSTDRSSGVRMTRCLIRHNQANGNGGGVFFSKNRSPQIGYSIVENNYAIEDGGGVFMWSGEAFSCLIRENVAADIGGGTVWGTVRNNTILNNSSRLAGGCYQSDVGNSIVYYNTASISPNISGGSISYSCVTPLVSGKGNIMEPPRLSGYRNWRLVPSSPCIDVGGFEFAGGDYDLEDDPRIWGGGVDMGCDEFYPPGLGGPLAVAVECSADRAVVGTPMAFQCDVDGAPESYVWTFTDGYSASNTPFVDRTFDAPGVYVATVTAWNPDGTASNSVSVEIFPGYTNYVSPTGAHRFPFTNWTDAATNIQDAIAANIPGGVVRVADGNYAAGGIAVDGGPTNRIAITNRLDVVSANGPANTSIVGQGPCGDAAVRCAYVGSDARLIGFTLTNGHTRASGDEDRAQSGGGAWCEAGGTLEDCVVRDNEAAQAGGGVKNGLVRGSALFANRARQGGGGGDAALAQCVVSNNLATGNGGGAHGGTIENALLAGNQAEYGGGAAEASLLHATVAHNHAAQAGGGIYRGVASNSIVYFNSDTVGWSNYFNSVCRYSCTAPDPQSTGNVTHDPLFADAAHGVYFLSGNSPAVDSAAPSDVETDLQGIPRPAAGTPDGLPAPDMGAYELTPFHFVAPGGGHVWPFLTWADAANDLQSAIDAADALDAVLVSNGVYNAGGRTHLGALTNRVVVDKAIRVASVNGRAATVIEGAGPIGDAAVRGVYLGSNACLAGFTVRAGATRAAGDAVLDQSGGGVWCAPGALVSNCAVESNSAQAFGGGAYGGRLVNVLVASNGAGQAGGGVARGEIAFCTVADNGATDGGGAFETTGTASIVYYNEAAGSGPNVLGGAWDSCCVFPDPGGLGHVTNEPAFLAPGDYRLAPGSPCIDRLPASASFPGDDLDGTPRPLDGDANGEARFDLGAQECVHASADTDGDGIPDDWEIVHGLNPLSDDASGDPDGDGLSNLQEYPNGTDPFRADTDGDGQSDQVEVVAGTDPLDPGSLFAINRMAAEAGGYTFSWPGRSNRLYTIMATDDLAREMTNRPDYTECPGAEGPMSFTNAPALPVGAFGVRVRMAP